MIPSLMVHLIIYFLSSYGSLKSLEEHHSDMIGVREER